MASVMPPAIQPMRDSVSPRACSARRRRCRPRRAGRQGQRTEPSTSASPSTGATPSTTTPAACASVGASIQRLTSCTGSTAASRGEPRKTMPKARVMLSADTAPTKARPAPVAGQRRLAHPPAAAGR
jgi:hypothetical protein